jgi:hypothetical protein
MADTVQHPSRISDVQYEIAEAQRNAKVEILERACNRALIQLQSIFDGIGRNEQVELVYPNGEIVLITKARKRGEKEGGE